MRPRLVPAARGKSRRHAPQTKEFAPAVGSPNLHVPERNHPKLNSYPNMVLLYLLYISILSVFIQHDKVVHLSDDDLPGSSLRDMDTTEDNINMENILSAKVRRYDQRRQQGCFFFIFLYSKIHCTVLCIARGVSKTL